MKMKVNFSKKILNYENGSIDLEFPLYLKQGSYTSLEDLTENEGLDHGVDFFKIELRDSKTIQPVLLIEINPFHFIVKSYPDLLFSLAELACEIDASNSNYQLISKEEFDDVFNIALLKFKELG